MEKMELDFLTCKVCKGLHNNPKTLPCLHSFCSACIEQTHNNIGLFCPQCREPLNSKSNYTVSFQTNYYLQNLADIYRMKVQNAAVCNFCELQGKTISAVTLCPQCKDFLCGNCSEYHTSTRLTMNHQLRPLVELQSGKLDEEIRRFQSLYCEDHVDEDLKLYCVDCSKPICCDCLLTHKSHKHINFEEAMKEMKSELTEVGDTLREKLNRLTFCNDNIFQRVQSVNSIKESCLEFLTRTEEQLISKIRSEVLLAKSTVCKETENHRAKLDMIERELQNAFILLNDPSELLQSITKNGNNMEKLFLWQLFKARQGVLHDLTFPDIDIDDPSISVSLPRVTKRFLRDDINLFTLVTLDASKVTGNESFTTTKVPENKLEPTTKLTENSESIESTAETGSHKLETISGECQDPTNFCEGKQESELNSFNTNQTFHQAHGIQDIKTATVSYSCDVKSQHSNSANGTPSNIRLKIDSKINTKLSNDANEPHITDVAWLSDDTFVVTDDANNKLKIFQDKGIAVCDDSFESPQFVSVSEDKIVCSGMDFIYVYNKTLGSKQKVIHFATGKRNMSPIACAGSTFVVSRSAWPDSLRLYKYDGKIDNCIFTYEKINVASMKVTEKESIVISNIKCKDVIKISKKGKKLAFYKPSSREHWDPRGLCTDDCDNIYIADSLNNAIIKLSSDLRNPRSISTEAQLLCPTAISWKDGKLLLSNGNGVWIGRLVMDCILTKSLTEL